jgi:ADP-heptose:LPS heptosyltransferase
MYDKRVDHKDGEFYIIHRHLALIKELALNSPAAAGAGPVDFINRDNSLVLRLTDGEKAGGRLFLKSVDVKNNDKKILFSISGTWKTKEWPAAHWVKLAEMIQAGMPGSKIIILWGPGDRTEIKDRLGKIRNVYLIPHTDLRQMSAIISLGDVFIGNDGASRHIAVSLGLKTIGLFGPTTERGWALADEKTVLIRSPREICKPCHRAECRENTGCMDRISPETVFEALLKLI